MTSTPPAWNFLHECSVPVDYEVCGVCHEPRRNHTEELLSIHSHKLPESDAFCERNDSGTEPEMSCFTTRKLDTDPTGEDVWPLERAVSTNAIGTCCAPECGCTAQVTDSVINAVPEHPTWVCADCGQYRYGQPNGPSISTWHWDRCGVCGRTKACTEPRDFGKHQNLAADNPFPDVLYNMMAEAHNRHDHDLLGVNLHDAEPLVTVAEPPKCPVCLHEMENDEGVPCDICGEPTGPGSFAVVNGPGGVFVYHLPCYDKAQWGEETLDTLDPTLDTIPLWKQALWLARHIEDLHSPRPDVLSDDELRGMTLIRVLGIGADEHGDEVFRKSSEELHEERTEEWSDGEFYDLVDRFGDELASPATASQDEDTALCAVTSVHS